MDLDIALPEPTPEEHLQELRQRAAHGDLDAKEELLQREWGTLSLEDRAQRAGEIHTAREGQVAPPSPRRAQHILGAPTIDPVKAAYDALHKGGKTTPTDRLLGIVQEHTKRQTMLGEVTQLVELMAAEPDATLRATYLARVKRLLTTSEPAMQDAILYLRHNYKAIIRARNRANIKYKLERGAQPGSTQR